MPTASEKETKSTEPVEAPPLAEDPKPSSKKADTSRKVVIVTKGYRGPSTNEQWVEPGTYEVDDPGLHGGQKRLIAVGRARIITENK